MLFGLLYLYTPFLYINWLIPFFSLLISFNCILFLVHFLIFFFPNFCLYFHIYIYTYLFHYFIISFFILLLQNEYLEFSLRHPVVIPPVESEPSPIRTRWYELKTREFQPLHEEYLHQLRTQLKREKNDPELQELKRLSWKRKTIKREMKIISLDLGLFIIHCCL